MEKKNNADALQKSYESTNKGIRAGKKTAKSAKTAAETASRRPVLFFVMIFLFFILILISIIGATSQSQMDSTYYLTAHNEDNGWNKPEKESEKEVLWEKDTAIEQSDKLMAVIQEIKASDKEAKTASISAFCHANGYDAAESLAHLQASSTMAYSNAPVVTVEPTAAKNETGGKSKPKKKGSVIQEFSLKGITASQLSKFSYESINRKWIEGTMQEKIHSSKKWYVDDYGLCKFKNDDGTDDFMVALGPYFGETGNRYRITFKNGTSATFLKFDGKAPEDTIGNKGIVGTNGGLLEFVVDEPNLHPRISLYGDVQYHPKKIFDQIKKIELIEGTMQSSFSMGIDSTDSLVLAAYSVAISNAELTKVDGLFGGFFEHVGEKYVNEKGFEISVVWFGENAGKIDYESDLKKRLKKFLRKGGTFYKVDYEKENGRVKVYTKTQNTSANEKIPSTGSNAKGGSKNASGAETISYVVPILTEVDIMDILYDLFEINPDDPYVNDDDSGVPNKDVITSLAEQTSALLYDDKTTANGSINISDLSGIFAWPAPGINTITSLFGNRFHPVHHVWKYHDGIDIGAPYGTSVVACEDGVVTLSGPNSGYGTCVEIMHDKGISTLYAHLQSTSVRVGQKVSKGQQIALSGNSGISTGPHLHLTIKVNGNTVDPIGFVLTPKAYKDIVIAPDA